MLDAAIAEKSAAVAKAGPLEVTSAQFGVFGADSEGHRILYETDRFPAVLAAPYGWYIIFKTSKPTVVWREEFELPVPLDNWGPGEALGVYTISPDRKTAVTASGLSRLLRCPHSSIITSEEPGMPDEISSCNPTGHRASWRPPATSVGQEISPRLARLSARLEPVLILGLAGLAAYFAAVVDPAGHPAPAGGSVRCPVYGSGQRSVD